MSLRQRVHFCTAGVGMHIAMVSIGAGPRCCARRRANRGPQSRVRAERIASFGTSASCAARVRRVRPRPRDGASPRGHPHASHSLAPVDTRRSAKTIDPSKRVRWDIDRDVSRGREFDLDQEFMPDGLSLVCELDFLTPSRR